MAINRTTKLVALFMAFAFSIALFGCTPGAPTSGSSSSEADQSSSAAEAAAETQEYEEDEFGTDAGTVAPGIAIEVSAPNWDDLTSMPCTIILEPIGDVNNGLTMYNFEECNTDIVIDCEAGDYTLRVVPPINNDGSTYDIPAPMTVSSTNTAEWENNPVVINLTYLAPEDVTAEEMAQILAQYEAAVNACDLQNMEKTQAISAAESMAEANPNYKAQMQ